MKKNHFRGVSVFLNIICGIAVGIWTGVFLIGLMLTGYEKDNVSYADMILQFKGMYIALFIILAFQILMNVLLYLYGQPTVKPLPHIKTTLTTTLVTAVIAILLMFLPLGGF